MATLHALPDEGRRSYFGARLTSTPLSSKREFDPNISAGFRFFAPPRRSKGCQYTPHGLRPSRRRFYVEISSSNGHDPASLSNSSQSVPAFHVPPSHASNEQPETSASTSSSGLRGLSASPFTSCSLRRRKVQRRAPSSSAGQLPRTASSSMPLRSTPHSTKPRGAHRGGRLGHGEPGWIVRLAVPLARQLNSSSDRRRAYRKACEIVTGAASTLPPGHSSIVVSTVSGRWTVELYVMPRKKIIALIGIDPAADCEHV